MIKSIASLSLVVACLLTTACGEFNKNIVKPISNTGASDIIQASQNAADVLAKTAIDVQTNAKPTTIVTTFVDSENFLQSSALGRTVSEQIAGRLAQLGFPVREIRLRGDILVKGNQGELLLSRELKEVAKEHEASAVVVGTYSEGAQTVFLSSKMIRLDDNRVISAHNFSLKKDHDVAALLHGVKEQDLYPKEPSTSHSGDSDIDQGFGTGSGNRTLMDAIREYDQQINDSRKKTK